MHEWWIIDLAINLSLLIGGITGFILGWLARSIWQLIVEEKRSNKNN